MCRRSSLLAGEGVGVEPNQTTVRKPGPLYIINSLLSVSTLREQEILITVRETTKSAGYTYDSEY